MPSWLTHALLFAAGLAIGRHVGILESGGSPWPPVGERVPAEPGNELPEIDHQPVPAPPPLPPAVSTKPKAPPPITLVPFPPATVGGRRWWS